MIENRLELNKKPVYELPEEVLTKEYRIGRKPPNFKPDICISIWGNVGKISRPKESANQLWIRTNNKELIDFIKNYDWRKEAHKMASPNLNTWKFNKILLEEFYKKL